ncbi:MAG: ATP-binding protein [Candidatus Aminicenantes bacterium]|nr:ATP-binding protein [Candidatus Aminicenantes bacterium]
MLGKEFRSLAEAVTQTYGNNPWFFLRELAQNSRDAGATRITVGTKTTPSGLELLTFADDGRGMSPLYARRFLFRLYASDKISDKMSAGKYGIGFWTILAYQPSRIHLQSRHRKDSWAVYLDADLEARSAPCSLGRPGTIISLTRPAVFKSAAEFRQKVEQELRAYCQYLRCNDRRGTMLPVFFHGQNITVPITLPGPFSYSFHHGAVEGAVGLGEKPLVRLYARGLPVWQGALLDQMSHLQTRPTVQSEIGRGLYPVFLLNGNQLDVTFSRNLVLENMAMEKVRKTAEKALRRLMAQALENAFPRKWYQRGSDYLQTLLRRLRQPGWKLLPLVLLIVLPLEIFLLSRYFPAWSRPSTYAFDLSADSIQYSGATVGQSIAALSANFSYDPPVSSWFRIFTAVDYDRQSGFVRPVEPPAPVPAWVGCEPEKTLRMRIVVARTGRLMLPLSPGHVIDPDSVDSSPGKRRLTLSENMHGEWSTEIGSAPATISYRSCPQIRKQQLTFAERVRLTRLPDGLQWPAAIERSLAEARFLPSAEKAARAAALVRELITYDNSKTTTQSYRKAARDRQWLARVLAIGKGDCDVINGVYVLLLRKMEIPARLAVGLLGNRGHIQTGLHAWGEYFDNGWQIADASVEAETISPASGSQRIPPLQAESPGAVSPRSRAVYTFFKYLAAPALIMLFVAVILGVFKRRKFARRSITAKTTISVQKSKEFLMPVIQQALLQPEIWGRQNLLWNYGFLPTLSGKPMAINRAFTLLRRKRLLLTTSQNPLAAAMRRRGTPILDLSQDFFCPLLDFLSGAVNLSTLYCLQPQPLESGGKTDSLLKAVNRLLGNKIKKTSTCLLSPGMRDNDFFYVSLPATPRQKHIFFPRRFIAVNPAGGQLSVLTALFEKNRVLAVFKFLQALNSESLLPVADPDAFLKKAARRLLRQRL